MVEAPCPKPWEIKPIPIVGDKLVSFVRHQKKTLKHSLVILILIPSQNLRLLVPFPHVPNTDDLSFMEDVVVTYVVVHPSPPAEDHVRRSFYIPKKSPYPRLHGGIGIGHDLLQNLTIYPQVVRVCY